VGLSFLICSEGLGILFVTLVFTGYETVFWKDE
jgi:hypothetical protein